MKKILGLGVIALGVFLEVMWLGVCFGTLIIGILLLIFAPRILFFPFTFFLVLGLAIMNGGRFEYSNVKYRNYNNSSSNNYSNANQYTNRYSYNSLDKYYEVLESQATDSFDVVKKNYRRLIKEYHYDSIASKDLPEEMVKFAEQKTQELNEAYAALKEARK